ncbi:MAG: ABC-F family ATP-binding cassette domain-containing protein, partial [Anaerolineales bacterium]|nr:ABC-F family ATP-binding cassette domain-containing protein [Anaerolineales bacterium]
MSQLLQTSDITKYYGAKLILNEVSLSLNRDQRLALVGENGVGKSTLVKIIAAELTADAGAVRIPAAVEMGYLPQETEVAGQQTIDQYLAQAVGRLDEIGREMRELEAQMGRHPADLDTILERYGHLQETFEKRGGYDLDYRIDQVL